MESESRLSNSHMVGILRYFIKSVKRYWLLVSNGLLLIINTLSNSLFGFLFWIICSRIFVKEVVGLGAAYVAALTLMTTLGEFGLGTALIRFAPAARDNRDHFINTVFLVLIISTSLSMLIFLMGVPLWSPDLMDLINISSYLVVFLIATLLFAIGQLVDRVFVAYQVSQFMLIRNLVANSVRIVLLVWIGKGLGVLSFLFSIGGGALVSMILSLAILIPRTLPAFRIKIELHWALLRDKIGYSLGNHLSLILWNAPPLIYPLVIVNLLGAEANAQFYVSWMIANVLFILPTSFATSVFANASNQSKSSEHLVWKTMIFSILVAIPGMLILFISSKYLLSIFGNSYIEEGTNLLFWLILSVIPYSINSFVITEYRINKNTRGVILVSGLISFLSLLLIGFLARKVGLTGIGIGWLVGQTVGVVLVSIYHWFSQGMKHGDGTKVDIPLP